MGEQKTIFFSPIKVSPFKSKTLKKFKCLICQKTYSTKGNLNNHTKTIHENIRPYKCDYSNCDKCYSNPSRLETHKRIHTGHRPFKCGICNKKFNEKGNLKTHLLFHSSYRPYRCEYCEHSYKTKGHLKEHILIHHYKIKKYKCEICNNSFGRNSSLIIHLKVHEKNKNTGNNSDIENYITTRPSSNLELINEENNEENIKNNDHSNNYYDLNTIGNFDQFQYINTFDNNNNNYTEDFDDELLMNKSDNDIIFK